MGLRLGHLGSDPPIGVTSFLGAFSPCLQGLKHYVFSFPPGVQGEPGTDCLHQPCHPALAGGCLGSSWGATGGQPGQRPGTSSAALLPGPDTAAPPPTLPGSQWQSLILTWVIYKHLKSAISLHLLTVRTEKLGGKPSHHPPNEQSVWVVQGNSIIQVLFKSAVLCNFRGTILV